MNPKLNEGWLLLFTMKKFENKNEQVKLQFSQPKFTEFMKPVIMVYMYRNVHVRKRF